jgi:hypothetical protein
MTSTSGQGMILYGIASALSGDVCDWHGSRDEAEATLTGILRDEPDWEGDVWVEPGELGEPSPN